MRVGEALQIRRQPRIKGGATLQISKAAKLRIKGWYYPSDYEGALVKPRINGWYYPQPFRFRRQCVGEAENQGADFEGSALVKPRIKVWNCTTL